MRLAALERRGAEAEADRLPAGSPIFGESDRHELPALVRGTALILFSRIIRYCRTHPRVEVSAAPNPPGKTSPLGRIQQQDADLLSLANEHLCRHEQRPAPRGIRDAQHAFG